MEIQYAMRHANIVEVIAFGLGDADHPPCLVMERMNESLYDLLGVQGIDLDPVSKVSIVQDVSEVCALPLGRVRVQQARGGVDHCTYTAAY